MTRPKHAFASLFAGLLLTGSLASPAVAALDKKVNGTGDFQDQREVAIARRAADATYTNGILCAAWNDVVNNQMGYGFSVNGGFDWTDKGGLPGAAGHKATADPDVDFRLLDQRFYISGHDTANFIRGIAVHRSATCNLSSSFSHADVYRDPDAGVLPDKPMMTINNWAGAPGNPRDPAKFHDRIFVTSTITETPRPLAIWRSDNGTTWLPGVPFLVNPYPAGYDLQAGLHGPWPTTAPSGRLYVAWVRFRDDAACQPDCFGRGPIDMQVSRSTDGGVTFVMENSPLLGGRNPETPGASCPSGLKGGVRLIPSPQIEADELGYVHMVYMAGDPANPADYSNVYYARGVPGLEGDLNWSAPIRLNTDVDNNADQFMPSLLVAQGTTKVAVYWYDRREATNPSAPQFRIYRRMSTDRGATWGADTAVSDVLSPVGGSCDSLGDYNKGLADSANLYMIWSDRRSQGSSNDTNVFFERVNIAPFCSVNYCAGEGTRCVNTGSSETCCTYQSVEDTTCTGPDLVPPNACPCNVLQ